MKTSTCRHVTEQNGELAARVRRALAVQHYPSLRSLDVAAGDGAIALAGEVGTFHERQLALALCSRVPGVARIIDRMTVSDSSNPWVRNNSGSEVS